MPYQFSHAFRTAPGCLHGEDVNCPTCQRLLATFPVLPE